MPKTGFIPNVKCKIKSRKGASDAVIYFELEKDGQRFTYFPGRKVEVTMWRPNKAGHGKGRAHTGLNNSKYIPTNDHLNEVERAITTVWEKFGGSLTPTTFRVMVDEELGGGQSSYSILQFIEEYPKDPKAAVERLKNEMHPQNKELLFNYQKSVVENPLIKNLALGKESDTLTLFQFIPVHIEQRVKSKATAHQKKTNQHLKTTYKHLCAMAHVSGHFDFEHINWAWMDRFMEFAYTDYNLEFMFQGEMIKYEKEEWEKNYAAKILDRLKTFVNEARRKGHTDNRVVTERGFSIDSVEGNAVILDENDIEILCNFDVSGSHRWANTLNLTIRAYESCLRFSDWWKIDLNAITETKGHRLLTVKTKKTGALVSIPISPRFDRVIKESTPPKISNQCYNENIKELCELAGLTKKIPWTTHKGGVREDTFVRMCDYVSAHDFRRSGLTAKALAGVSDRVLRIISGHSTDAQLHAYLRIGDKLALVAALEPEQRVLKVVV